jgi:hypothetical protein
MDLAIWIYESMSTIFHKLLGTASSFGCGVDGSCAWARASLWLCVRSAVAATPLVADALGDGVVADVQLGKDDEA